jgi:hypothetical protein
VLLATGLSSPIENLNHSDEGAIYDQPKDLAGMTRLRRLIGLKTLA